MNLEQSHSGLEETKSENGKVRQRIVYLHFLVSNTGDDAQLKEYNLPLGKVVYARNAVVTYQLDLRIFELIFGMVLYDLCSSSYFIALYTWALFGQLYVNRGNGG